MRAAIGWTVLGAILLSSRGSTAAPPSEAERLFRAAQADMAEKRYDEACRKFEASHELERATGSLLNLANCHQLKGALVVALREWRQALSELGANDARVPPTRRAIATLEERIPSIQFVVPQELPSGATLRLDGSLVDPAAMAAPTKVDPGDHEVIASSRASSRTVRVTLHEGEHASLPFFQTIAGGTRRESPPEEPANLAPLAFVVGGVGAAAAVVTGIVVLGQKSLADEHCPTRSTCDADGVGAAAAGRAWLAGNAVAWGIAALGIGAGVYFTFRSKTNAVVVSPSTNGVTLGAGARF